MLRIKPSHLIWQGCRRLPMNPTLTLIFCRLDVFWCNGPPRFQRFLVPAPSPKHDTTKRRSHKRLGRTCCLKEFGESWIEWNGTTTLRTVASSHDSWTSNWNDYIVHMIAYYTTVMCFIHTSHCQLYRLSYHISASLCAPILSRKLWGQPTSVAAAVFGKPGAQNWSRDVRSVQRQNNQRWH